MDEDAVKNEFQHELLDKEWMVNIEFIWLYYRYYSDWIIN
jgi:hypothetical protein